MMMVVTLNKNEKPVGNLILFCTEKGTVMKYVEFEITCLTDECLIILK